MLVLSTYIHCLKFATKGLYKDRKLCFKSKVVRVVHACNPSIWEAKAGILLKFKSAWATEGDLVSKREQTSWVLG